MSAAAHGSDRPGVRRLALVGNPNTGKTTLFNRLTGLRQKTSNFPGTTQDARVGFFSDGEQEIEVIDLPGVYSMELDQSEAAVCRGVLSGTLAPAGDEARAPDSICVVLDATNLSRNLTVAGEALRRRLPTVVALTMADVAERRGIRVDAGALSDHLGCRVLVVNPRSNRGVSALRAAYEEAVVPNTTPPGDEAGLTSWAEEGAVSAMGASGASRRADLTDRLDRLFTHPVIGLLLFAAVMTGLFLLLFRYAGTPMDMIDGAFGWLAGTVHGVLPEGLIADLLADGVIAGVGATVIFLPQIALLFFVIALLEDSGYLARASFVMDRVLRPFGLRGHAFVPLLSSHACALPGIMSCRAIPDRRERLAAILVAPFMTCSARIPVYVLFVVLLFPGDPTMQAVAFIGCYVLGVVVGLLSALLARRTILKGGGRPMALELPSYRLPSIASALRVTADRSWVFLRKAGTVILAISIVLWWLGSYPQVGAPPEAEALRVQAASVTSPAEAVALESEADRVESRHAAERSFMGRIGRTIQPVFEPLGYDWQLSVGVMASFAAREVFVSTMAVVTTGEEDAEDEGVLAALKDAKRSDGVTPIFTVPTAWSLLVYYVLAMQCLPTLAVTAHEAGGKRWAALQLGWMMAVAYVGALIAFLVASALVG